jgi:hypothetical protein
MIIMAVLSQGMSMENFVFPNVKAMAGICVNFVVTIKQDTNMNNVHDTQEKKP